MIFKDFWKSTASVVLFVVTVTILVDFAWENTMLQTVSTNFNNWAENPYGDEG
ncbi:unnamed protein product [marine sediment metagenome]|uniref:Uncharacterized protein n=1 Tax=marine sediment metagenome TaxID=412755 RepID=X1DWD3_9ZZZZ